jgi:hypothetical protein
METAGASWQLGCCVWHTFGAGRGACPRPGPGVPSARVGSFLAATLKTRPRGASLFFLSLALLPAASVGRPCRRASPSRPSSVSSLRPPPSQVTLSPFWCPRSGRARAAWPPHGHSCCCTRSLARSLGVVVARYPDPLAPLKFCLSLCAALAVSLSACSLFRNECVDRLLVVQILGSLKHVFRIFQKHIFSTNNLRPSKGMKRSCQLFLTSSF